MYSDSEESEGEESGEERGGASPLREEVDSDDELKATISQKKKNFAMVEREILQRLQKQEMHESGGRKGGDERKDSKTDGKESLYCRR